MKKDEFISKLREIFDDAGEINVREPKWALGTLEIELASVYETPKVGLAKLIKLGELIGSMEIENSGTSHSSGCDTCDYGSSYGTLFEMPKPEWLDLGE